MKRLAAVCVVTFSAGAAWATVDYDTVSTRDDWVELCNQTRTVASKAARLRDQGIPEDKHLQVTEEVLREGARGPKTRHVIATLVKGAYLRPELSPKAYGSFAKRACQEQAEAAFAADSSVPTQKSAEATRPDRAETRERSRQTEAEKRQQTESQRSSAQSDTSKRQVEVDRATLPTRTSNAQTPSSAARSSSGDSGTAVPKNCAPYSNEKATFGDPALTAKWQREAAESNAKWRELGVPFCQYSNASGGPTATTAK